MNIFKNFFKSIKPAFARFPAVFISSLACAVFATLYGCAWEIFSTSGFDANSAGYNAIIESRKAFETLMTDFIKASAWTIIFSFFSGIASPLLLKKIKSEKKQLISLCCQIFSIAIFGAAYFIFKGESVYKFLAYCGTLSALLFCSVFLLFFEQEEKIVVPNIIISGMIAGISSGCICSGLLIIRYAISTLLINFSRLADAISNCAIMSFSSIVCCTCIFTAYATKPKAEITTPKAFKVIFMFILFPLYLILLFVLYAYLAKSLFTLTLPSGKINWFVSFATVFYLVIYFSVRQFKNTASELFCKWGSLLLILLIITQLIAFSIRINAYGYTPLRYASLLYILFSIVCVPLALVKNGKYISLAFPLFAGICIFASLTPMNIIDFPQRNQIAKIEGIYKKAGLILQGTVDFQNVTEKLNDEQKARIIDSYDAVNNSDSKIKKGNYLLAKVKKDDFEKTFGFAYSKSYGKEEDSTLYYKYFLRMQDSVALDISQYSALFKIDSFSDKDNKAVIKWGTDKQADITQDVLALVKEVDKKEYDEYSSNANSNNPVIIKLENGFSAVFVSLTLKQQKDFAGNTTYLKFYGNGYVCK